jgi:SAM-dependent methyltransferase
MNDIIQAQLLDLNRRFYAAIGVEFDRTRQSLPTGMVDLAQRVQQRAATRILDAGCGNGRFAKALAQVGAAVEYTGLDADAHLLVGWPQTRPKGCPASPPPSRPQTLLRPAGRRRSAARGRSMQ